MLTTNELLVLGHRLLPDTFRGVYPRDLLPTNIPLKSREAPVCLIYNTDSSNLAGVHWACLICYPNGVGEVFDSFGQTPQPIVTRWMTRHCSKGWTYNQKRVQGLLSTLCGAYCLYYLYFRLQTNCQTIDKLFPLNNNDVLINIFKDKMLSL